MRTLKKEAPTSFSSMPSLHLLDEPVLNFKKESMENHKQQQQGEEEDDGDHEANVIQPQSSSSSFSPCSSYQEHAIKEDKTKVVDDDDGEEEEEEESKEKREDGYQTPTSPRSRIPVILRCPPAPKKPKWRKRHLLHPHRRKTTITSYFTLVLQAKVDPRKLGH